ncbi:hypothetical protein K7432_001959 [Basidiobolus ranarum]|uniref:Uncharacterized protein n=1 Tax=Basidiobolus ranarum TaxID=34480 RepID=A0ABR2W9F0_9FUNG
MFSFSYDDCPIDLLRHLLSSQKEKKPSMAPLLQKRLREITDLVFLGSEKSTTDSTEKIPPSLDYSDDLERVRIKLREVLFADAIAMGFTGDANDTKFETLKFTLTPKVARNWSS